MDISDSPSSALDLDRLDRHVCSPYSPTSSAIYNTAEWPSTPCLKDLIEDSFPVLTVTKETSPVVKETGTTPSALVTALSTMETHFTDTSISLHEFKSSFLTTLDDFATEDFSSSSIGTPMKSPFAIFEDDEEEGSSFLRQPNSPELYGTSPAALPPPSPVPLPSLLPEESKLMSERDPLLLPQQLTSLIIDKEETSFILTDPDQRLCLNSAETFPTPGEDYSSRGHNLPILGLDEIDLWLGEAHGGSGEGDIPGNDLDGFNTPIDEAEITTTRPEATPDRPDAPIARPDAPIARPDAPIARPDAPIARPDVPIARPDVPIARPDVPIARPDVPIARPAAPIADSGFPIARYEMPAPQPQVPIGIAGLENTNTIAPGFTITSPENTVEDQHIMLERGVTSPGSTAGSNDAAKQPPPKTRKVLKSLKMTKSKEKEMVVGTGEDDQTPDILPPPVKMTTRKTLSESIKARRRSKGMDDIVIEAKRARPNEMTPADTERLMRRQASNRRAAAKCRQKKKDQEEETRQVMESLADENAKLRQEILEERRKKQELEEVIRGHMTNNNCRNS